MLKNKKNNKEPTQQKDRNQRILNIYSLQQSSTDLLAKASSIPLKKNNKTSTTKHKESQKATKNKRQTSQTKIKKP